MALTGYIILAGATVTGAISERRRAKKAERKAEELKKVEMAQARDAAARERRQQIREARVAQARITNAEAAAGETTGSASIAAASNIQSQVAENIGTINTTLATNVLKSELESDIFNLQQPSDFEAAAGVVSAGAQQFISYTQSKRKK